MRIGDRQAIVDGGGRGAPVFMQLEAARASEHHFFQRCGQRSIALAHKAEIHREGIGGFDHAFDMPGAGAGGGQRAVCGAGAAAQHGGHAGIERFLDLLRGDEMDMAVNAARR